MYDSKEVEISLKVFINKEKTKVLFAEADNDFVDVLLSFLTLPLGKIIKILEKHYGNKAPSVGSLTSLLKGLANPENNNLWTKHGKEVLDNPKAPISLHGNLKVSVDYTNPTTYAFGKPYKGVFTRNSDSYIICDDLLLVPNAMGSIMQTLSKLGIDIMAMQGAEMRNVSFGLKEIIHLLKGSLSSRTPLSDLVLDQRQAKLPTVKREPGISMDHIKNVITPKKMILKIMFQKPSKKLLFAQAGEDFVDFLFSLLILPLGMVEWLLGKKTGLTNIHNVYRSVADLIDEKYLKGADAKDSLMKPKVNSFYSKSCFLPLSRSRASRLFVARSRMFMITDDLTVTRLCVSSTLSILGQMNISLSDVQEVELRIGLEEALNILKASLTSTCALTDGLINRKLTDGLINPKLKKQPKQKL